jgi:hypothetical protein
MHRSGWRQLTCTALCTLAPAARGSSTQVATPAALRSALLAGVTHIVVTGPLDMSELSRVSHRNSNGALLEVNTQTKSIRVRARPLRVAAPAGGRPSGAEGASARATVAESHAGQVHRKAM